MSPREYRTKDVPSPLDLDTSFYIKHGFKVVVELKVNHRKLHRNAEDAEEDLNALVRNYYVEYKPEVIVHKNGHHENTIHSALEKWFRSSEKLSGALQYTLGFVMVRGAYNTAVNALGLTDPDENRTFGLTDVLTAYPWISQQILNHRIQQKFVTLKHPARGKGTRHSFSLAELVHVAVVDEIASMGALTDLSRVRARMVW